MQSDPTQQLPDGLLSGMGAAGVLAAKPTRRWRRGLK